MGKKLIVAGTAILLSACGMKSDAPVKREPGSWSTKVEILELAGKGVKPDSKISMQQYFDLLTMNPVCLTPEMAARDDIRHDIESAGGAGKDCRFDKQKLSRETVEFSGTCTAGAKKIRLTAQGTSGATARDVTMTVEQLGPDGKPEGLMKMRTLLRRTGDCTPGGAPVTTAPAGTTK